MIDPIYFLIARAKKGEIEAIGRLAPATQVLTRPLLDISPQKAKDKRPLGSYIAEKIREIRDSWGTAYDIYLDFSRYEPDIRLPDGRHIAEYTFDVARQLRLKAVPVLAPPSMRGPGSAYFEAVSKIVARDMRGAAMRLPYEYFSEAAELERVLGQTLAVTSLSPEYIDVYLDAFSISLVPEESRDEKALATTLRTAATAVQKMGYRRVIFSASSYPDSTTRHRKGKVLRVERTEFRVWRSLAEDPALSFLLYGDYGIIHPGQVDSDARVIPPSRIRITTENEYILYKGDRDGIRKIAEAARNDGSLASQSTCWGDNAVRECAAGYGDPGGPAQWISRDENMHIERTVAAMSRATPSDPLSSARAEVGSGNPWLQDSFGFALRHA